VFLLLLQIIQLSFDLGLNRTIDGLALSFAVGIKSKRYHTRPSAVRTLKDCAFSGASFFAMVFTFIKSDSSKCKQRETE